jgi:hypothetical protein
VTALSIVPPVVFLLGAVALMVILRQVGNVLDGVDRSMRRSRRVEDALIPVRVETRRARRSAADLRRR